ncbi:prepilin-type N-terminal cleavage/methylation domain-containing protein [Planctomycetota bacterium]
MRVAARYHNGFTMLEVVVVIAIVAVLAAIAIPRLSRGSAGAEEAALEKSLAVLRRAIELYAAEHLGKYPLVASIDGQLTQYTDEAGKVRIAPDTTHIYGPYLRDIPPLPVGRRKGNTKIALNDAVDVGWLYRPADGHIWANTGSNELSASGVRFLKF